MQNFVRQKREQLGLSQTRLARMAGISQGILSNIELGKHYAWPKVKRDLARALRVPESALFPEAQNGK